MQENSSQIEKTIYSRREVMIILGISKSQLIRLEKHRNLKPFKLFETRNGSVYYKKEVIDALLTPKVA